MNKLGAITRPIREWGSKARKEEEHQHGLRRVARADAISEGLSEMVDTRDETWYAHEQQPDPYDDFDRAHWIEREED